LQNFAYLIANHQDFKSLDWEREFGLKRSTKFAKTSILIGMENDWNDNFEYCMFRKCSPPSANPINEAGLNGDKIENHIVLPTVYHTLAVIVNCAARVQFVKSTMRW
jgi:hypothetical protein